MTSEHEYDEPFEGMRAEMPEAEYSIRRGKPIHWKEVLDDLMFTLNFHFEWLCAEDILTYRETIVPFLMNVIAAMPLNSAKTLLALYDAAAVGTSARAGDHSTETGRRDCCRSGKCWPNIGV